MTDHFFERYILNLFDECTSVTLKQLHLIAIGKRTPSVLYTIEKNKLYALFTLFPACSIAEWKKVIQYLVDEEVVKIQEGFISLTPKGIKEKSHFNLTYPYSNDLDQLRFSSTKERFWHRLIFITQIFSEYSYHNKKYVPYVSTLETQYSVKRWLIKHEKAMDELCSLWYHELTALFSTFPIDDSNLICRHFVGHQYSGSTSRQLQEVYGLTSEHYTVLTNQLSYQIGQQAKESLPLLASLWDTTHADCNEGLSHSAWLSKTLLEKGMSITDVAKRRKLKPNTVKEHILECVLIVDWPEFKTHIDPYHYALLHSLFETSKTLTFSEAKAMHPELDFFSFRLIEIERGRHIGY